MRAERAKSVLPILGLVLAWSCAPAAESGGNTAAAGAPAGVGDADRELLGDAGNTLFWSEEEQVPSYRNYDLIYPTRRIDASDDPYPLPSRPVDLSGVRYEVAVGDGGESESFGFEDFLEHNRIAGLLVIHGGDVVLEHYGLGNDRDSRWVSYSIAKSVVSLLVGAAVEDGYIASLDEPVTSWLPILRGSSYDGVTLRHALWMSSGVAWDEDYADPESDVARSRGTTLERLRYLGELPRVAPSGETFNYNTGETHLVGAVLRAAIGNNLSTYLTEKIWRPFGMEADANWMLIEPGGAEHGGCCISATLRDYGRLGLFAMSGGVLRDGTRVLPEGWMEESIRPSPGFEGYGYLWWLRGDGVYNGIGIFGQAVSIDPANEIVMVTHSAWPTATDRQRSRHRAAFFAAVTETLLAADSG
ncbi:MAG: serine hydrolase domain-containing protein [Thermoanaerobaculia bacterium]|nr:serine hydrolase domain-containing protein [Thermoanaerobaculia bacterium]